MCLFLVFVAGVHLSLSSTPSPKLPKSGVLNGIPPLPMPPSALSSNSNGPNSAGHHLPLLTAHSFLYNPVEPYIFPITIPPGFPSNAPDFMRLFAPNMAAMSTNSNNPGYVSSSSLSQGSLSNSRSNGTNTPPEQNGQAHHSSPPPQPAATASTSSSSRHSSQTSSSQHQQQPSRYRQRQHYPSESLQFQPNGVQRQAQNSYSQQPHNRKACYTCGDLGHLAFACPEQYPSDSTYPHGNTNNTRGKRKDSRLADR